jgi:hypothetical protein
MRMSEINKGEALFLDDERFPVENGYSWTIVRNYDEAAHYVLKHGMPCHASFDHDLGQEKSGYDFVKWLVELDMTMNGNTIPKDFTYYVHSQNPIGVANINAYLQNYLETRNG